MLCIALSLKLYETLPDCGPRPGVAFSSFNPPHPTVTPLLLFHSHNMLNDMIADCPVKRCICSRCFYCCLWWHNVSVIDFFLIPEWSDTCKGLVVVCWIYIYIFFYPGGTEFKAYLNGFVSFWCQLPLRQFCVSVHVFAFTRQYAYVGQCSQLLRLPPWRLEMLTKANILASLDICAVNERSTCTLVSWTFICMRLLRRLKR